MLKHERETLLLASVSVVLVSVISGSLLPLTLLLVVVYLYAKMKGAKG